MNEKITGDFESLLFGTPNPDPEIRTLALGLTQSKDEDTFVGCLYQFYSIDRQLMEHGTPMELTLAIVAKLKVLARQTDLFARKFEKKARSVISIAGALNSQD